MKNAIRKNKEVINSTSSIGQAAGRTRLKRGKGLGPGTALSPKSVVGTQVFMLISFFASYPTLQIFSVYTAFSEYNGVTSILKKNSRKLYCILLTTLKILFKCL